MQFQIISLLALAATTSAVPVTSAFKDKCGNSDANRACLIGLDQLGHNVAFTVEIGVNANNVNSVLVSQNPNFSVIGLELETNQVSCTGTCILIDADGAQTECADTINHNTLLTKPGDKLNLSNVQTLVAVDCQREH